ncbi:MAG: hypothetical protein M3R08_08430, partial [Bacteroidota bacterium]|nr:hypothetical protein [Bacteroidota bacterium]
MLLISLLLQSCATDRSNVDGTDQVQTEEHDPLQSMGIRYDGHYKEEAQGVVYLIRFFPTGKAVLINGTSDVAHELPAY